MQSGERIVINGRDYRLGSILSTSAGSYGQVWAATDPTGRAVALKFINTDAMSQADTSLHGHWHAHLEREIVFLAGLNAAQSRHVVTLLDHGRVNDQPVLVLERLQANLGQWLARQRRNGAPPPDLACILDWAEQILDGLEVIHRAGFVYRDLKFSNILVGEQGALLKLADFGSLKRQDGDSTRSCMGTPATMAPEQALPARQGADGCEYVVDYRADYYALGLLLFTLLTEQSTTTAQRRLGQLLALHGQEGARQHRDQLGGLTGDERELLRRATEFWTVPARPEQEHGGAALLLTDLLDRLLARDPAARPASSAAIRTILDAVRADQPAPPRLLPDGLAPPPDIPPNRHLRRASSPADSFRLRRAVGLIGAFGLAGVLAWAVAIRPVALRQDRVESQAVLETPRTEQAADATTAPAAVVTAPQSTEARTEPAADTATTESATAADTTANTAADPELTAEATADTTAEPATPAEAPAEPEPMAEATADTAADPELTAEATADVPAEPEPTADTTAEPATTADATAEPEPTAEAASSAVVDAGPEAVIEPPTSTVAPSASEPAPPSESTEPAVVVIPPKSITPAVVERPAPVRLPKITRAKPAKAATPATEPVAVPRSAPPPAARIAKPAPKPSAPVAPPAAPPIAPTVATQTKPAVKAAATPRVSGKPAAPTVARAKTTAKATATPTTRANRTVPRSSTLPPIELVSNSNPATPSPASNRPPPIELVSRSTPVTTSIQPAPAPLMATAAPRRSAVAPPAPPARATGSAGFQRNAGRTTTGIRREAENFADWVGRKSSVVGTEIQRGLDSASRAVDEWTGRCGLTNSCPKRPVERRDRWSRRGGQETASQYPRSAPYDDEAFRQRPSRRPQEYR